MWDRDRAEKVLVSVSGILRQESMRMNSISATNRPAKFLTPMRSPSLSKAPLFVLALLLGLAAMESSARAAFVVTMQQVGSDVVATGSGSINTSALTNGATASAQEGLIVPDGSLMLLGAPGTLSIEGPVGVSTGPASFGAGAETFATSGTGDAVGLSSQGGGSLTVPQGYVSSSPLSDTSTYTDSTFASLGITPGTYTWTWGSGATADSFTLDAIGVPEPASFSLLGIGSLGLLRRRVRRSNVESAKSGS